MLLEVSLILHANPLATIAARRFASVTTAGFGVASKSVAHAGTTMEIYVNAPLAVAVPFAPVPSTDAVPTDPAGVTAVTVVEFTATTFVAGTPPTLTLVAPFRNDHVIVIAVPPR